MSRGGTFASIDIGTSKVCTVVGEVTSDEEMRILGVGVAPSEGLSRGMVENIRDATESIRASVEKAERSSGTRILSAHVGIAGQHIACLNNRGIIAIPDRTRPILPDDVARVLDGARVVSIPTNREIIHVIPRYYVVDGQDNVSDPVGMYGTRLDVETHIVTGIDSAIQNVTKCVENCGVQVDGLILEPLASAEAVLDEEEKEQGVVLADIGGGTTDIALFIEGSVCHTAVLPVGGNHVTRDIVVGLRAPYQAAEEAKRQWGHAIPSMVDAGEEITIEAFGSEGTKTELRRRLCEIIQARMEEILEMVTAEVKRAVHDDIVSAGIVLTGGGAKLSGIDLLAEQVTGWPARVGMPRHLQGLTDLLIDPAYATSVGLLQWAVNEAEAATWHRAPRASFDLNGFWRRVGNWARVLLPE
ncbi:MAG TPA: cell division protein FtsA [Dehalococcoidia bacterium]|nr:cell division protein FtsA [Dehalococcoidia bacterium]